MSDLPVSWAPGTEPVTHKSELLTSQGRTRGRSENEPSSIEHDGYLSTAEGDVGVVKSILGVTDGYDTRVGCPAGEWDRKSEDGEKKRLEE